MSATSGIWSSDTVVKASASCTNNVVDENTSPNIHIQSNLLFNPVINSLISANPLVTVQSFTIRSIHCAHFQAHKTTKYIDAHLRNTPIKSSAQFILTNYLWSQASARVLYFRVWEHTDTHTARIRTPQFSTIRRFIAAHHLHLGRWWPSHLAARARALMYTHKYRHTHTHSKRHNRKDRIKAHNGAWRPRCGTRLCVKPSVNAYRHSSER